MKRLSGCIGLLSLGVFAAFGAAGCTGDETSDTLTSIEGASLGDALPGTNATRFAAAKANFNQTETTADGLGPIFNQNSCGSCHSVGAPGGAGQNVERRYGTLNSNGTFNSMGA
ncbi:MAG TPA: hypothetical protein VLT58_03950, partial [Polyangia bacterium]|nr:hypothetical protein [Polyangia bacterium]